MAAGELGHQKSRDLRRIREWLVVNVRQTLDQVMCGLRLDEKLCVMGAEVLGDAPGMFCFVELLLAKANRECLNRIRRLRLHQRDDGRGIDAAGQERAKRHIGDHAQLHSTAQERVKTLHGFTLVVMHGRGDAVARDRIRRRLRPADRQVVERRIAAVLDDEPAPVELRRHLLERVAAAALRWREEERSGDFLLPEGKPLADALELVANRREDLDVDAVEFIESSRRTVARGHQRRLRLIAGVTSAFFAVNLALQLVLLERELEELRRECTLVVASHAPERLDRFATARPALG